MLTAAELGRIQRYVDKAARDLKNLAPQDILDFIWLLLARNNQEELADLGLPVPQRGGLRLDHDSGR